MVTTIFKYEFKKVKNSVSFWLLILAIFCIGILSLYNGKATISQQNKNIAAAIKKEDVVFTGIIKQIIAADTSTEDKKWDYNRLKKSAWFISSPNKRWTTYNTPLPMSVLSIGNRDIYPYYHEIEPYSFYMRFFKTEIANPTTLLIGNIDLAFVIIFLFPLFIIALTFNLQSAEIENGTYQLLNTLAVSAKKILAIKGLFYFLIALLLLILILLSATLFVTTFNFKIWLQFLGIATLYLMFWFLAAVQFNKLKKSSLINISFLLGLWIILLIALPAIGNAIANVKYNLNSNVFSETTRRIQFKRGPETLKNTLQNFIKLYPKYKNTDTAGTLLIDKAFVVSGDFNDQIGDSLWAKYELEIKQKENFIQLFNFYNPAVITQLTLNKITQTNLANYLQYVKKARKFTQEVKMDVIDKVMNNKDLTINDFTNRKKFNSKN